ncbi:MAG: GGDEF domain-containing protein [Candidatus Competibacteraceae bacterium]
MATQQTVISELSISLIALLMETLGVDSAALLRWDERRSRFTVVHQQGLPLQQGLVVSLAEIPVRCNFGQTGQAPPQFLTVLRRATALRNWIWLCDRRAGLALLLGDTLDIGLNRDCFDPNDHHIVETALAVYVTLHHLHQAKAALRNLETHNQASPHRTRHDALTDLPNRTSILAQVQNVLDHWHFRHELSALLLLAIDRLNVINNGLECNGDHQTLAAIGQRLQAKLRPGDSIVRWGDREFLVLLRKLRHPGDAMSCAARLQQELSRSYYIDSHEVQVSIRIGIALNNGDYQRADDLLRDATIAMQQVNAHNKVSPPMLFDPAGIFLLWVSESTKI